MNDFFDLMLPPFVACIVLTGIHAYFGLHILRRGVIFVDLALAQLAAFGATLGFLFGMQLHSTSSYVLSLILTLIGAALFAVAKDRKEAVCQEAFIGIVYAVAAAASVLVLSRAPQGGEELKNLMVGHLLFIDWNEILTIVAIYSGVAGVHVLCRKVFLLITHDSGKAVELGYSIRAWDFLFYATLGIVVTSSTEVAGVLLVFSFLVVPAVCGALLASTVMGRLVIAWVCGLSASIAGILLSYLLDLPTGATIVCTFAPCILITFVLRRFTARLS